MSKVFVLDTEKRPLNPVNPGRARCLLNQGRAAVFRHYPFTIILKEKIATSVEPLRVKIDPGSKTTGLAIVNDATGEVVWAAELSHRGQRIHEEMASRAAVRRGRRQRKTRYRQPRFLNRHRPQGWLPPSLESRVANVITWVNRIRCYVPIEAISMELVKFDTQKMENPEIGGVEYQQGELAGYEVREYLLEKWHRTCAYCGKKDTPLQIEHINPRSRGGSNRVSNLTLACEPCNLKKGTQTAEEFGHSGIQARAKAPLRDATVVNTTRWALYRRLVSIGPPVEVGTGGRTKWNRTACGIAKSHWADAACVGASTPPALIIEDIAPLLITGQGWGCRQMCLMNKYGFPRTKAKGSPIVRGFRTGDMIIAVAPRGKNKGRHCGRVAVRSTGKFNVTTAQGTIQGIPARWCRIIQKRDGYRYDMATPHERRNRDAPSRRPAGNGRNRYP